MEFLILIKDEGENVTVKKKKGIEKMPKLKYELNNALFTLNTEGVASLKDYIPCQQEYRT